MKQEITQNPNYYYKAYFCKTHPTHLLHKIRLDKLLSFVKPNTTVLDAGCGSGILSYLLLKQGNKVTGVDIRKDCISFIAKKSTNGKFMVKDLIKLNLNKKFDVVVCSDVIEHFKQKDRVSVIRNLNKHVKNKGELIFSFPSKLFIILEKPLKLLRKLIYSGATFDDEDIHEIVNLRDLSQQLNQMGYSVKILNSFNLINYVVAKK